MIGGISAGGGGGAMGGMGGIGGGAGGGMGAMGSAGGAGAAGATAGVGGAQASTGATAAQGAGKGESSPSGSSSKVSISGAGRALLAGEAVQTGFSLSVTMDNGKVSLNGFDMTSQVKANVEGAGNSSATEAKSSTASSQASSTASGASKSGKTFDANSVSSSKGQDPVMGMAKQLDDIAGMALLAILQKHEDEKKKKADQKEHQGADVGNVAAAALAMKAMQMYSSIQKM